MRFVKISDIKPGMVIAMPIMDANRRLLLNRNKKLNTYTIMKLNEYDYKGIYIYDELSEGIDVIETIPIDLRLHAIQAAKNVNFDDCMALAGHIIENIYKNEFIETNLTNLSMFDNDTYNHSVNVASYAAIVGITKGYDEEQLRNLTAGALLHDIGKSLIPIDIITKEGRLTEKERKVINKHPTNGYKMVKDTDIPSVIKVAIYEHHENVDGTGYPRGIKGKRIHETAKIIHVCDVYDAMISRRSYKDKINPAEVIEYLYSQCGKMFDYDIVTTFVRKLMPYPKGVTILLSNGETAIVKDNDEKYPLRPIVRMIRTGEDIELSKHNEITIVGLDDI